jgi:predicted nucleotide-binding protein (sugar kinase/HSP70/actin superfamily)
MTGMSPHACRRPKLRCYGCKQWSAIEHYFCPVCWVNLPDVLRADLKGLNDHRVIPWLRAIFDQVDQGKPVHLIRVDAEEILRREKQPSHLDTLLRRTA